MCKVSLILLALAVPMGLIHTGNNGEAEVVPTNRSLSLTGRQRYQIIGSLPLIGDFYKRPSDRFLVDLEVVHRVPPGYRSANGTSTYRWTCLFWRARYFGFSKRNLEIPGNICYC